MNEDEQREIDTAKAYLAFAAGQLKAMVECYRKLKLDSPEDQEVHDRLTATSDAAIERVMNIVREV